MNVFQMKNRPHFSIGTGGYHFTYLLSCLFLFFGCLHVGTSEEEFPKEKCEAALPECDCEKEYMDAVGLSCLNLRNFTHFSRTLSDGSVFEVNTTYDIILIGVRVLPRGFLNGLILKRLYIDDIQTEVVEEGAFDGILQLQTFRVQLSSIQVADAFETRCGSETPGLNGHVIWSLTEMQLCPDSSGTSLFLVIGFPCVFLVVPVAAFLMILYWTNIKMWLFAHGMTCFSEHIPIQNIEVGILETNQQENQQRLSGTGGITSFPPYDV
ncbi:unnamed protein product [Larinioides sclopetarius]|uniref:Uncharacterized protein n=1 Tax=Larinioides sclopetarius TaxID=280406 RepID=A0AAV1ZGR7_9ARAC